MTKDDVFALYALEMNGELDTRFSKIRKIINNLNFGLSFELAVYKAGLHIDELTSEEIDYIMSECEIN